MWCCALVVVGDTSSLSCADSLLCTAIVASLAVRPAQFSPHLLTGLLPAYCCFLDRPPACPLLLLLLLYRPR